MNLLLTLGHNSSAILTNHGHVFCGYEEERLTRIKSCSEFPEHAIRECLRAAEESGDGDVTEGGHLYVSHWYDDYNFMNSGFSHKHWNPGQVKDLCEKYKLKPISLKPTFTHHDAHAYAALAFWSEHSPIDIGPFHICVADGFGNRQEVFSIYHCHGGRLTLKGRIHGYENSLGLLYQYATSFCGMKENQDEYKFLGYESYVQETLNASQISDLQTEAKTWAKRYYIFDQGTQPSVNGQYIDVNRLGAVKSQIHTSLEEVVKKITGKPSGLFKPVELRRIIGHFVQCIIENFYSTVISEFDIESIVVTGGLHYNVKLNNHIMSSVPGDFCATPLAGDQGAAIGLMAYNEEKINGLNGLLWGHRNLKMPGILNGAEFKPGHFYFDNPTDYVDFITKQLLEDRIVNTVTGAMEFGPRALCNTSTLALPTEANVQTINSLNGRDTVMPMAPVMLEECAPHFFPMDNRVVGSLEYMILTLDYHPTLDLNRFRGIMHPYPVYGAKKGYSGRPQLVGEHNVQPIRKILKGIRDSHPALINTSLNVHGVPIVFSLSHALMDMQYNLAQADEQCLPRPILVIGAF